VYRAENGKPGSGSNKTGQSGNDMTIKVPVGTVIRNFETNEILVDLTEEGQTWLAAKGGRGGKGNAHFVSSTFQAPKFAQPGMDGDTLALKLELKLLADVGIIGFPNAGKSTLISRISAAHPKVADYAFTTLSPVLGVVQLPDYKSFVVADIPGLIEGAHRGEGLGHKFLKHIERTRLFVHLIDGAQILEVLTGPEAQDDAAGAAIAEAKRLHTAIRTELDLYNEELLNKSEILVINKSDVLDADIMQALCKNLGALSISGVTGQGIPELIHAMRAGLEAQADPQGQDSLGLTLGPQKTVMPDDVVAHPA
jgi:GTP-binding protein